MSSKKVLTTTSKEAIIWPPLSASLLRLLKLRLPKFNKRHLRDPTVYQTIRTFSKELGTDEVVGQVPKSHYQTWLTTKTRRLGEHNWLRQGGNVTRWSMVTAKKVREAQSSGYTGKEKLAQIETLSHP